VRKDVSVARGRESEKDRDGEGPVDVNRDRGSCTLGPAPFKPFKTSNRFTLFKSFKEKTWETCTF